MLTEVLIPSTMQEMSETYVYYVILSFVPYTQEIHCCACPKPEPEIWKLKEKKNKTKKN